MVERKDTASDEAFQGVRAPVVVIVGPTASGFHANLQGYGHWNSKASFT